MEPERARALLDAERARVQQLLADLDSAQTDDREAERETGDMADPAQPLAEQGVDDAVAAGLRDRLAALDRALQRLEDGTYGRSIRTGAPSRTNAWRQTRRPSSPSRRPTTTKRRTDNQAAPRAPIH